MPIKSMLPKPSGYSTHLQAYGDTTLEMMTDPVDDRKCSAAHAAAAAVAQPAAHGFQRDAKSDYRD